MFITVHTTVHQSTPSNIVSLPFEMPAATSLTTRFNIQSFYTVLTLRLCVSYRSQNKQRILPYRSLRDRFCTTDVESVYCAVRSESLHKTDTFCLQRVKINFSIIMQYMLIQSKENICYGLSIPNFVIIYKPPHSVYMSHQTHTRFTEHFNNIP